VAVGNLIPDPRTFGLHFALPAMFIGLLIMQIKGNNGIILVIFAFIMSLLFKQALPGNWYIILASVITATIGVVIEKWTAKYFSSSSV
jgi:predicted branched-subunit amino acid permease